MKQYIITHFENAVKIMTEHYKEKFTETDFSNLFFEMRYNNPEGRFEVVQIGQKQAWVITDTLTGNKFLQSYSTIVSIYFKDTDEIKTLGKWSRTTSKHQTYFYGYCH